MYTSYMYLNTGETKYSTCICRYIHTCVYIRTYVNIHIYIYYINVFMYIYLYSVLQCAAVFTNSWAS